MPDYQYKAVNARGQTSRGLLPALNEQELSNKLEDMGLSLVSSRLSSPYSLYHWLGKRQNIQRDDVILLCFELAQLTQAGVPLLQALSDLKTSLTQPSLQTMIASILAELNTGKLLSQALSMHPQVFDAVFISLIQSAEHTGKLAEVLAHLHQTLKWQQALHSQIGRILAYPALVLVVVLAATLFLMLYLVPQMQSFLVSQQQSLPWYTLLLIQLSHILSTSWHLLFAVLALGSLGLALLLKHNARAQWLWASYQLKLPILGSLQHKIILSRMARYFALMYQTGIPVMQALKHCESIVANQVMAQALAYVQTRISAGDSLSKSFEEAQIFPPLVLRMLRLGEQTGALDKSLLNISALYDQEVQAATEKMLKLIEPVLTIFLGLLLGFAMFAILGPIYSSLNQFKF
jgi:type IV pilus assembly protein PilC